MCVPIGTDQLEGTCYLTSFSATIIIGDSVLKQASRLVYIGDLNVSKSDRLCVAYSFLLDF
jgi:hypothetical protein